MTLDSSPPFNKAVSILPRASDVARCPRRSVMFTIPGTATEDDPALLSVPSSPSSFLGLELCMISVSIAPRALDSDAERGVEGAHQHVVNVCMRLTDGSGRAYGPALTLVACRSGGDAGNSAQLPAQRFPGRPSTGVVASNRVAIPIATGGKVVMFTKTSPSLPPEAVAVVVTGHALFESHRAADRMILSGALGRMIKNCNGVPLSGDIARLPSHRRETVVSARNDAVPQRVEEQLEISTPLSSVSTPGEQRVPSSTRSLKRGRSDREINSQGEEPPPLEYRFIPGGADES